MSLVNVDFTVARAHHDAAGMVAEPEVLAALEGAAAREKGPRKPGKLPRWPAARQLGNPAGPSANGCAGASSRARLEAAALGRSRGGLTSKVRLAADRRCRPLAFVLTPGQAADTPRFIAVLEKVRVRGPVGRPRTRPDAVAADKAYSSRASRACLRRRGIKAVIPEKADQAANRKKRGRDGGRPVALTLSSTRSATRWSAASTDPGMAGPGHALRQDARELPGGAPATRIHHLDAQPQPGARGRGKPAAARQTGRRRAIVRSTSRGTLPAFLGRNRHERRGRGSPGPPGWCPWRPGNRRRA